jgi:hypothetical protein
MTANYIITFGFILVSLWMLYRAYAPRLKSRAAQSWPTTTADILETGTEEDRVRSSTGKANIAFVPTIRYSYTVNGKKYEGDRITFAKAGFEFITASNIRDQFKEGTQTEVSYNPKDPSESVLRPVSKVGMFSPIPGIFMLIVGIVLAIYTFILLPGK